MTLLAISTYGLEVELAVEPARLARRIEARLPPHRRLARPRAPDRRYRLLADGAGVTLRRDRRVLVRGVAPAAALDELESDLQRFVAEHARERLFVHAGVVAWRGRALVLPGRSHAGKSTLVAALVRSGARYYSDEYAVLDAHGRVHPFPRPLALRRASGPPRRWLPPAGTRPLPVAVVALLCYRADGRFATRPLSPGRAVLALFKHTVAARQRTLDAFDRLALVAKRARSVYGSRGEASDAARRLLRLSDEA